MNNKIYWLSPILSLINVETEHQSEDSVETFLVLNIHTKNVIDVSAFEGKLLAMCKEPIPFDSILQQIEGFEEAGPETLLEIEWVLRQFVSKGYLVELSSLDDIDFHKTLLLGKSAAFSFNQSHKPSLHDETLYRDVCLIGGGTAGYLTALALRQHFPQTRIRLIESSKIPIIGVGEATTPVIQDFLFNFAGLNVIEFFKAVQPTWKLGIKFFWGLPGNYFFNYPFGKSELLPAFLSGNINDCSISSILMSNDASFILKKNNQYISLSNEILKALHIENKAFIRFIGDESIKRGVERIDASIVNVNLKTDGSGVDSLDLDDGRKITAEFFIDCSGFRSLLLKSFGTKFNSFESSLYTNRAVITSIPNKGVIAAYTYAESMQNGWCWNIPLRESNNRGYVFSKNFCSDDEAVDEMKRKNPEARDFRFIDFRSGRHEIFMRDNFVAIGNSYGFVEPLESTGIHMLIDQIKTLCSHFRLLKTDFDNSIKTTLNREMNDKWDTLRWFLSLHYKFNKKYDTKFWKECNTYGDISGYQHLVNIYKRYGLLTLLEEPIKSTIFDQRKDGLFGLAGVDNILLGQGVVPDNLKMYRFDELQAQSWNNKLTFMKQLASYAVPIREDAVVIESMPYLF